MEMKQRTDLQNNVTQQLKTTIAETLSNVFSNQSNDVSLIYNNLVRSRFVSISPPLEEPPMMQLLTMDSLRNYKDGSSIKPGNILLNIRKLIEAIPEVVSIGAGMISDNHIVTVCGALSLWLKLRDIATINISKEQAFVIVALWKNCNSNHKISLDDGFIATNNLFDQYGEPEITSLKYNMIIDSLVKIECIELTEEIIWLREWISKNYIYDI
ncbi:MAG: hypothetical protein J6L85_02165 [Clostridia bacterium]|nr:hypothetical protein [Clostridia bacterium]